MSNSEFQMRLERINAKSQMQLPHDPSPQQKARSDKRKPDYLRIFIGGLFVAFGQQGAKFANENYDAIKNDFGIGLAIALGIAALAGLIVGSILAFRGFFPKHLRKEASLAQKAQDSKRAKSVCSLLGLAFGTTASLSMFVYTAARSTGSAESIAINSLSFAFSLLLISLLLGISGLFRRGSSLRRVPFFFLLGGALTLVIVRSFAGEFVTPHQIAGIFQ